MASSGVMPMPPANSRWRRAGARGKRLRGAEIRNGRRAAGRAEPVETVNTPDSTRRGGSSARLTPSGSLPASTSSTMVRSIRRTVTTTDHTGLPATEHRARFDAFPDGYRSVSPYDDQDLGRLPLFAGLHAAASLVSITRALGEPARQEPEWLSELRDALTDMARAHRQLVIDIGRNVGRGIRWRFATTVEALLERSPRPASPPLPEPPGSWGEWRRSW